MTPKQQKHRSKRGKNEKNTKQTRREGEKSVVVGVAFVVVVVFTLIVVAVAPFNEGPSAVALALIAEAFKTAAGASQVIKLTINYADPPII